MPCHHFSSSLHCRRPRQASAPSPTWCLPFFASTNTKLLKYKNTIVGLLDLWGSKIAKIHKSKLYSRCKITEQKIDTFCQKSTDTDRIERASLCSLYGKGTSTKARNDLVNRPQYYPNPNPNPQKQNCTNTHSTQIHSYKAACPGAVLLGAMFADCNFCQHFVFDQYCTNVHFYVWGMVRVINHEI